MNENSINNRNNQYSIYSYFNKFKIKEQKNYIWIQ